MNVYTESFAVWMIGSFIRAIFTGLSLLFVAWVYGVDILGFSVNERFFLYGLLFVAFMSVDRRTSGNPAHAATVPIQEISGDKTK